MEFLQNDVTLLDDLCVLLQVYADESPDAFHLVVLELLRIRGVHVPRPATDTNMTTVARWMVAQADGTDEANFHLFARYERETRVLRDRIDKLEYENARLGAELTTMTKSRDFLRGAMQRNLQRYREEQARLRAQVPQAEITAFLTESPSTEESSE